MCIIEGCESAAKARGYCGKHWQRWRRYGDPLYKTRDSLLDLRGARFGRLVCVEPTDKRDCGSIIWLCVCDCGNVRNVKAGNLRSGNTASCGCAQTDMAKASCTAHGETAEGARPVRYLAWWSMIARCKYPSSSSYEYYGGKGISVCDQWQGKTGYQQFSEDMGDHPGKGWSIDRIDPNGNYCPSNCRWIPTSRNISRAHSKATKGTVYG